MCIHAGRQRSKFGINDVSGATESSDLFLKDNPAQFRPSGGVNPCNLFILTSGLFVSEVACAFRI